MDPRSRKRWYEPTFSLSLSILSPITDQREPRALCVMIIMSEKSNGNYERKRGGPCFFVVIKPGSKTERQPRMVHTHISHRDLWPQTKRGDQRANEAKQLEHTVATVSSRVSLSFL